MGIGINPSVTFDWYTVVDGGEIGNEKAPSLTFKYLSWDDWQRVDKLMAESYVMDASGSSINKILEAAKIALVGWKNQPIPYDPNDLAKILSPFEILELREADGGLLDRMAVSEMDKKKSFRASTKSTMKSASETPTKTETQSAEIAPQEK